MCSTSSMNKGDCKSRALWAENLGYQLAGSTEVDLGLKSPES